MNLYNSKYPTCFRCLTDEWLNLDQSYMVFARVVEGMENVDRILEGDVMESVEILRR